MKTTTATKLRRALPLIALITLFALVAAPALAAGKSLQWERLDGEITVQPNGDLRVVETNVIHFTGGAFTFGYRDIDRSRLAAITSIQVTENGQPLDVSTGATDQGNFRIRYNFPAAFDEARTFVLAYTVQGATRYYEQGDQVYWAGVYAARNGFPVLHSRLTVRLPPGAAATKAAAYGPPFTLKGEGENTVIAESTAPIPSGQEFEVRVQFPHGIISGQPAPWQAAFDQQRDFEEIVKPRNDFYFLLAALLVLFGGPGLAVALWFRFGRDPRVDRIAGYLNEPPAGLSPGLAGALVDEKAGMQDIVATLIDLARRGMLVFKEGSDRGYFDQTILRGPHFPHAEFKPSHLLSEPDLPPGQGDGKLALHEWMLLDALALNALPQRALSAFQETFYRHVPSIQDALYRQLVNDGYYHNSPDRSRRLYQNIARALLIGAGVFGLLCVIWLSRVADTAIVLALALAVTGLAFLLIARVMPVRTRKGAEAKMRAEAFRNYLQNISQYTDVQAATDLYERYLPYAIAFGMERSWTQRFAATRAPAPGWYLPAPEEGWHWAKSGDDTPLRDTPAPAAQHATVVSAQGTQSGDMAGPVATAPVSLQRVNEDLTATLSSLNSKLVDMFSSVGRTFASQPPPESVTAARDMISEVGDALGEWLSSAGSSSSSSGGRSSSSSHRSNSGGGWSGGGSRSSGSSGGGGGGFG